MVALTHGMVDALNAMGADIGEDARARLLAEYGAGSAWSRMENLNGTEACPNRGLTGDCGWVDCMSCGVGECWPWGTSLLDEIFSELRSDVSPAIHGEPARDCRDGRDEGEIPF